MCKGEGFFFIILVLILLLGCSHKFTLKINNVLSRLTFGCHFWVLMAIVITINTTLASNTLLAVIVLDICKVFGQICLPTEVSKFF